MLGLFKKMLSKSESVPATPFVKAPPVPTAPNPKPVASVIARPVPVPVRPPLAPAPQSTFTQSLTAPTVGNNHVQVALAAIATALPESISHKVPASPEQFVAIPVDKVLPQLAHGMVLMTVGELLECAPEAFAALAGNDDLHVTLPLGDIVKQLSPEHFTRRSQKRVEIPEEVTSVFAAGISGVSISKPVPTPAVPITKPQSIAAPAVTSKAASLPSPSASVGGGKIAMSPQALAALAPKTTNESSPTQKSQGVTPQSSLSLAASEQPSSFSKTPTGGPTRKHSIGLPKVTGELAVPLSFVSNNWADEVRAQLAGVVVADAQIQVPLDLLQPAMQSGRVLFSWEQVASWIRPPLLIPPTQKVGEMALEFPLKVVAPLFMAHHRAATQKRVAVDQSIPDLFGGSKIDSVQPQVTQPTPSAGVNKKDFAPAVVPRRNVGTQASVGAAVSKAPTAPLTANEPARINQPPAQSESSLEEIIGKAASRLSAKEIVANTSRLPGVGGVLLAMSDGLLVTSNTPPQLKAETIAAFLPQMFGRMNQYTKELALGPLQQLTLGVESGQWNVFKGEAIYFAVLGKCGELLPLNLLAQVAAELSSQSK